MGTCSSSAKPTDGSGPTADQAATTIQARYRGSATRTKHEDKLRSQLFARRRQVARFRARIGRPLQALGALVLFVAIGMFLFYAIGCAGGDSDVCSNVQLIPITCTPVAAFLLMLSIQPTEAFSINLASIGTTALHAGMFVIMTADVVLAFVKGKDGACADPFSHEPTNCTCAASTLAMLLLWAVLGLVGTVMLGRSLTSLIGRARLENLWVSLGRTFTLGGVLALPTVIYHLFVDASCVPVSQGIVELVCIVQLIVFGVPSLSERFRSTVHSTLVKSRGVDKDRKEAGVVDRFEVATREGKNKGKAHRMV